MANRADAIQHLVVNVNSAASNVLVAGESGKRLWLVSAALKAAGAVNVTFEDEDGTDLMGLMPLVANDNGIVMPENGTGWTKTPSGKGLNLLLGGAVQVGGSISYRMMPDHFEL